MSSAGLFYGVDLGDEESRHESSEIHPYNFEYEELFDNWGDCLMFLQLDDTLTYDQAKDLMVANEFDKLEFGSYGCGEPLYIALKSEWVYRYNSAVCVNDTFEVPEGKEILNRFLDMFGLKRQEPKWYLVSEG